MQYEDGNDIQEEKMAVPMSPANNKNVLATIPI